MLMFSLRGLQINPQKKFRIQLGFESNTFQYQSDTLTIRPLGPLIEERRTSYISSIA